VGTSVAQDAAGGRAISRCADETELRLVGVEEVAVDGEQPSDFGHGEELARRSLPRSGHPPAGAGDRERTATLTS
jgi:hypothetical protein